MDKRSITINDIAEKLSVSPSTVSRALNNSSKISEETRRKVWELANEMGYDLNLVASSLFRKKTNIIGVLIPVINRVFFSQVLSGIEEVAHEEGYRVIIAQSNESFEKEQEILKTFSSTRVDGVLACLSLETRSFEHFSRFRKNGNTVVMFDRIAYDIDCSKVIVDNFEGAYLATEHLIKTGCKNLVHLAGPSGSEVFSQRANGFLEAVKANKLSLMPNALLQTDLTSQDVRDVLNLWMEQEEKPDGIFTANASTGLQILNLIKGLKIKIPDEIAVISFGNEPCNEYIEPSLSAIEMPGFEMGKSAARQLINEIDNSKAGPKTIIKPIQLLIRNSSFKK